MSPRRIIRHGRADGGEPLLAREALELGALAYIDKPFDLTYLERVVAIALQAET